MIGLSDLCRDIKMLVCQKRNSHMLCHQVKNGINSLAFHGNPGRKSGFLTERAEQLIEQGSMIQYDKIFGCQFLKGETFPASFRVISRQKDAELVFCIRNLFK